VSRALPALLGALALAACGCTEKTAATEARSGLRVPLPDGWRATAVAGGLHVGPFGHVALQLESTTRPMPSLDELLRAVEREKVIVTQKEALDTFVGVRFRLGADGGEGFLGVRQAGTRTIWCATTREAAAADVEAAMTVCRSLSWDASG
jgi:hypothetical protein